MKILITGFPGTGKTTIAQALKSRGRTACDPQSMRSYMHNDDKTTGRHIRQPKPVPTGWYDRVADCNWDSMKVRKLIDKDEDIYICSLAANQAEFYDILSHKTHFENSLISHGATVVLANLPIDDVIQEIVGIRS